MKNLLAFTLMALVLFSCQPQQNNESESEEAPKEQVGFPFVLPQEKPNRDMSAAMERIYTKPARRCPSSPRR